MGTEKYDLYTIDFGVQGWDALLTSNFEKLDAVIPSRILGTLGETVAAYDALYLKSDGKWYKAQADGSKQPCLGIAMESGAADDQIRVFRVGKVTNSGWSWTTPGNPLYLSPTTAGEITETKPSSNVQVVGYVLSSTEIILTVLIPGQFLLINDPSPELAAELNCAKNSIGFTEQVYHSTGSITIDWRKGNKAKLRLDANTTLSFTDPSNVCSLLLMVIQDGTGSRTITWPANVKWPGGTPPTLSTGAFGADIVEFYFDGTNYYGKATTGWTASSWTTTTTTTT